ncbi:ABC transporter ATP-binding protein [Methylobacterium sp. JK268]
MADPLLSIQDLEVRFATEAGEVAPVSGVDVAVAPGETVALVGESGSGKSVSSLAVMGLLPRPAGRIARGRILYRTRAGEEIDLARAAPERVRRLRGAEIAMIFQEPMTSLNPVLTAGEQIAESVRLHLRLDRRAALRRAQEMLELVEIPAAAKRLHDYPHQMSGGMRQRVMIALAMACHPRLLIADEPTTALDVTIQAQILALIDRLRRETGMGVLFITHNLGVVAEIADRVAVMYAGRIVETGPVGGLFRHPRHPYTAGLLDSLPARAARGADGRRHVRSIPGSLGGAAAIRDACAFSPRCERVREPCRTTAPPLEAIADDRAARCLYWREM